MQLGKLPIFDRTDHADLMQMEGNIQDARCCYSVQYLSRAYQLPIRFECFLQVNLVLVELLRIECQP